MESHGSVSEPGRTVGGTRGVNSDGQERSSRMDRAPAPGTGVISSGQL